MYKDFQAYLQNELNSIKEAGLYKEERVIVSPQGPEITLQDGTKALNFCANNYLGLADSKELVKAAKDAMDTHGYGMASVRFICGTGDLQKTLEAKIAEFFGTEDTILYAACFDANGGVFEPLLNEQDAIISDSLNHASIIDGVRLCKAKRYRYAFRRPRHSVTASSLPTVCSPWTATYVLWTRFTPSPRSTTPWSWSMSRTPQVS